MDFAKSFLIELDRIKPQFLKYQRSSGNVMTDMNDHFANFIILHSNSKSKEFLVRKIRTPFENCYVK